MNEMSDVTLLELVNHIITRHPGLASTIENFAQDIIYKRRDFYKNQYFGLNQIDEKLEKYLNYENGYFIELGANDGVTQSNTLYFEKNRNWRGILVEPVPHNYLLCLKNRSSENKIYCNACVSNEFKEKFVEIIYSNLMSVSLIPDSDIKNAEEHAKNGIQFLNSSEKNFSFGAPAITLDEIFEKSKSPNLIDFFSLDVEGAELDVLRGINHQIYRFKYILVESREFSKLQSYLSSNGYKFIESLSEHDYLFSDSNF